MRLFLLALRNLTRNGRRTLLTGFTIAFGVLAVVALQGFVNTFIQNSIEATVFARVGAVQVFRKGYVGADEPLKHAFSDEPKLLLAIRAVPGVTAVAPRLDFDGMVSNGTDSTMFVATAVDPALEYSVCPKRWTDVDPGSRPLGEKDEGGAVVGRALAEALGAQRDSTLVLQSAGPHAGTNALDVSIVGFLPSHHVSESKRMATVSLSLAQRLLRMRGQITSYVVGVADLERVDETALRLQAALGDDYEVTTWQEMAPTTRDRVKILRYSLAFITLVLVLLVATGIINTMLMSVYERVREIGTMLAVGVRRRQVTALFLFEASSLGFFGGAMGTVIGCALVYAMRRHGIAIKQPGSDVAMILRPEVGAIFLGLVIASAVAGTVVAALYPAWKASRLSPAQALRSS